jgi:pilus assembly protein FimV
LRKLNSFLLALLLVPAAAYALGLGDIHLRSGLNQPLSAEIDLLSVEPDDVPTIVPSLASSEAFAQVGLDRPMALLALEFTVEQRPNGTYFIKAVTQRPVRDPFLDFLLEVNWRSGRLLRDYTILLDPPDLMKKEAPPAVRAPAATTTSRTQAPATARAARPAGKSGQMASAGQMASDGSSYGPVRGNETLWRIANKMRPSRSVSVPQVMMALLKGNPDAFEDNNVNRLKAGTVLRLDPALLQAMTRAEAAREIARQDRQWQDYKQQAAAQATRRAPTGEAAVPRSAAAAVSEEPRLKLVAPEATEVGKTGATGSAPANGAENLAGLQKELMLAQEASEAASQENQALRNRVKDLEKQIEDMQRLLSLQNDELATLQRELGNQPQAGAVPQAQPAPAGDAKEPEVEAAASEEAGPAPAEGETAPAVAEERAQPPANGAEDAQEPATAATGEDAAKTAEQPVPAAKTEEPKPAKKPAPRKPVVVPPPRPEPGLLDGVLANPVYSGLFLLVGVMLITLLVLIVKRRRSGGNFTESILMGGTPSMMKAKAAEGKGSEESSFFSDFAVSGMGDIQAEDSEVDPLTEADVYMAYQRYQQAEDLVLDALKHNPERPELHVKLLEVYHATKDTAKFEAEAEKTHQLLGGTGPLWDKVLVLGHELLPDHALFAKAPEAPAGGPDHADARLDNEVLDIGLDLDALTEEMESGGNGDFNLDLGVDFSDLEDLAPKSAPAAAAAAPADEAKPAAEETGFDLDLDALAPEPEAAPAPAASQAGNELDFDLGDLSLDDSADKSDQGPAQTAPDFDLGDLSFGEPENTAASEAPAEAAAGFVADLSLTDLAEAETAEKTPAADFDLGDLSLGEPAQAEDAGAAGGLELGDVSLDDSIAAAEPEPAAQTDGGLDLGDFDLGSLDLGSLESEPSGEVNLADMALPEQNEEDLLLGDINEVDTKLDLARAYVGMGDGEGARNLIDEVMQEGDATQKQQAEELLKQIA